MKKEVNAFDYAGEICKALKKGILLTTQLDGKVNTMTIGWGTIGVEWRRPVFVTYVRESRYTRQILDQTGEFTINIPLENVDSNILAYCGTKSGRDVDKIADLGLSLEAPISGSVPGIKELPLTLECKVVSRERQDPSLLSEDIVDLMYSKGSDAETCHVAYYGEIQNAYIITD